MRKNKIFYIQIPSNNNSEKMIPSRRNRFFTSASTLMPYRSISSIRILNVQTDYSMFKTSWTLWPSGLCSIMTPWKSLQSKIRVKTGQSISGSCLFSLPIQLLTGAVQNYTQRCCRRLPRWTSPNVQSKMAIFSLPPHFTDIQQCSVSPTIITFNDFFLALPKTERLHSGIWSLVNIFSLQLYWIASMLYQAPLLKTLFHVLSSPKYEESFDFYPRSLQKPLDDQMRSILWWLNLWVHQMVLLSHWNSLRRLCMEVSEKLLSKQSTLPFPSSSKWKSNFDGDPLSGLVVKFKYNHILRIREHVWVTVV